MRSKQLIFKDRFLKPARYLLIGSLGKMTVFRLCFLELYQRFRFRWCTSGCVSKGLSLVDDPVGLRSGEFIDHWLFEVELKSVPVTAYLCISLPIRTLSNFTVRKSPVGDSELRNSSGF